MAAEPGNFGTNGHVDAATDPAPDLDDIDRLKAELERTKLELRAARLAAAERDHLREHAGRAASFWQAAAGPGLAGVRGTSRAPVVADARIGTPRRILVVGGGPAGLISLHELLNPGNRPEGHSLVGDPSYEITLYERRAEVGGVWYFEPGNEIAKGWHHCAGGLLAGEGPPAEHAPPTSTHPNGHGRRHGPSGRRLDDRADPQPPTAFSWHDRPHHAPRWASPAYEGLVGNVLPPLLEFGAVKIAKPAGGLFPSMAETHKYLLDLAAPLRQHICTNVEVVKIDAVQAAGRPTKWSVEAVDWTTGSPLRRAKEWDAVIIAAGAFDHPWYPPTPGLAALLAARDPLVMHAKKYPGPRPFRGRRNRIVVVGNANSANDIAAHLAPLNDGPVYRCARHASKFAHLADARIEDVAPIARIERVEQRGASAATLTLTLEDGTVLAGITQLIFATGYQYDFGWVSVPRTADPSANAGLVPASLHGAVPNLHNATMCATAPTLAFVGLAAGSTPMPLAEIQARVAARVLYGVLPLPGDAALLREQEVRAQEVGPLDPNQPGDEATSGGPTWRALHMVRGAPERRLTAQLLAELEAAEPGASAGLFQWDEWREGVVATMRAVKEGELARVRDAAKRAGGAASPPVLIASVGAATGGDEAAVPPK